MSRTDNIGATERGELHKIDGRTATHLAGVDLQVVLQELWNRVSSETPPSLNELQLSLGDAICERLSSLVDVHLNRFARTRYFDLFGMFQQDLPQPRPPIQGATYLYLGCGSANPYGFGALMVALGARASMSLDLDPIEDRGRAVRAVRRVLLQLLQEPSSIVREYPIDRDQILRNVEGLDLARLAAGDPTGLGDRLTYAQRSAYDTGVADGTVDVVLSNSFLEHVDDLPRLFVEMARVTKRGGFGVHAIDGIDHWSYGDPARGPHDFLCDPTPGMLHGCNRVRPLEFPAMFEKHGFRVQSVIRRMTTPMSPAIKAKLLPPWAALPQDVLETSYVTLVVRRE